jgi:hypothetical protein
MSWFSKDKVASDAASRSGSLQIPDQLAQAADRAYGNQDFIGAFRKSAEAVDKIHTMCVMAPAQSRIRQPSDRDDPILDRLTSALGGSLAVDPNAPVADLTRSTVGLLMQIANEAAQTGHDGTRYAETASELEGILNRAQQ